MGKREMMLNVKNFKFADFDSINTVFLKLADVLDIVPGKALSKAQSALDANEKAFSEDKTGIHFDKDFLRKLNPEALIGIIFWMNEWTERLEPIEYYKETVDEVCKNLVAKYSKEDRQDEKIAGFKARRKARYNEDAVTRYKERKLKRLDARWITIGHTPADEEAGIPAGKGRHVLIDDDGTIISGAGGSLTGVKLKGAKSTSGEVKVDPSKVSTAAKTEAGGSTGAGGSTSAGAVGTETGGDVVGKSAGEGGSKSKAEPGDVEKKKLRIVSSGEEFAAAAKGADAETIKSIMGKMPGNTKVTLGGEKYRKKTNGEWVLDGHKKPQDIDEIAGKDWSSADVLTPVDVFKTAVEINNAQALRDMLDKYAVGTIIQFQRDGKWALERKNSGWVVTNAGGVWSGTNLGDGENFKDIDEWKSFADNMDNWFITRRKDTPSETKPDDTLLDMFDKEAEKDAEDRDFEDLLDRCEPGTEISVDGNKFRAIGKDGKYTIWAEDTLGKDYFEGDSWYFADQMAKGSNIYVGGKKIGGSAALAKGREVAKADWSQYTTKEYLKSVPSLKHYEKKVDKTRHDAFKSFSDDELKEANELLRKLFDTAEYCARFDAHKIDSFVENGLLNQFETGTSHGFKDPGHGERFKWSHELFGTELKKDGEYVDGKDFEKYGFISAYEDIKKGGDACGYGNACLIFDKDAVKDRVTFTHTDSLCEHITPGKAGGDVSIYGMFKDNNEIMSWNKEEFLKALRKAKDFHDFRANGSRIYGYCEAQYHGKMPISTVKEIILPPGTTISAKSQAKLDEYGIKITYKTIGW